jgi:hypothetical protein
MHLTAVNVAKFRVHTFWMLSGQLAASLKTGTVPFSHTNLNVSILVGHEAL